MSTGLEKDLSFHTYMTSGSIDSPFNVSTKLASLKQNWPEEHTGASLPPHEASATMPGEQWRKPPQSHSKLVMLVLLTKFCAESIFSISIPSTWTRKTVHLIWSHPLRITKKDQKGSKRQLKPRDSDCKQQVDTYLFCGYKLLVKSQHFTIWKILSTTSQLHPVYQIFYSSDTSCWMTPSSNGMEPLYLPESLQSSPRKRW